jgi:hypothetical protein
MLNKFIGALFIHFGVLLLILVADTRPIPSQNWVDFWFLVEIILIYLGLVIAMAKDKDK